MRDASKAYRANIEAPLLKWKLTSTSEEMLPVKLACWPSQTAEGTEIILEYEVTASDICLEDVHIIFPCPPSGRPAISSADPGEAVFDAGNHQVHWHIPQMDSREGSSGTLEFTAAADTATLLPFSFTGLRRGACKCPIEILESYHQGTKDAISVALSKTSTYHFTVGG